MVAGPVKSGSGFYFYNHDYILLCVRNVQNLLGFFRYFAPAKADFCPHQKSKRDFIADPGRRRPMGGMDPLHTAHGDFPP